MDEQIRKEIDDLIEENRVVLFMKGTAKMPSCGFSAKVVHILNGLKVEFKDVNILVNQELREGIKIYSQWPTIPQLYINKEFVGGCDVALAMWKSGDLQKLLIHNENT